MMITIRISICDRYYTLMQIKNNDDSEVSTDEDVGMTKSSLWWKMVENFEIIACVLPQIFLQITDMVVVELL